MNQNVFIMIIWQSVGLQKKLLPTLSGSVGKVMGKPKALPPSSLELWTVCLTQNHLLSEFYIKHHHLKFIGVSPTFVFVKILMVNLII